MPWMPGRKPQAASAGARNIQADLVSMRDEVARLTHQIADIFAAKGTASWQRAKSDLDGVISDAGEKGREAIGAAREVGDNVVDAVDKSLRQRPYTALALAAGLGFLFESSGDVELGSSYRFRTFPVGCERFGTAPAGAWHQSRRQGRRCTRGPNEPFGRARVVNLQCFKATFGFHHVEPHAADPAS